MTTAHVFIATSLDGFIARPDGGLDWLLSRDAAGEDHGYEAFIAGIDAVVMGRESFLAVQAFDPWPYPRPVVVLSRSRGADLVPEALRGRVEVWNDAPQAAMDRAAARGWQRVYLDGGAVIRAFLAAGLVEDMVVTVAPVLIGEGRPLFGATGPDIALRLLATTASPSGLVQMRFARIR